MSGTENQRALARRSAVSGVDTYPERVCLRQTAYTYQGPLDLGGAVGKQVPPARVPTGFAGFLH